MTGLRATIGRLIGGAAIEIPGAPPAEFSVAPSDPAHLGRLLSFASEHGLSVLPWGSGTHQGFGGRITPDIVVATSGLDGIHAWEPDDLTVVVGAGCTVSVLAGRLSERRQTRSCPSPMGLRPSVAWSQPACRGGAAFATGPLATGCSRSRSSPGTGASCAPARRW